MGIFPFPLDCASDGVCQWDAYGFSRDVFRYGPLEIVHRHSFRVPCAMQTAASIEKPPVLVEEKEMWSPQRAIRPGDILRLVVQIEPGKSVLLHSSNHMVKIVFRVRLFAVRVDADEANTVRCVYI